MSDQSAIASGVARSLAEPKSRRGRRSIELPPSAVLELRDHRKRLLAAGHPHGYVFPDVGGRPLRGSNLLRRSFIPLDTYSHVLPSMQRDAAIAIEQFFLPAGTKA